MLQKILTSTNLKGIRSKFAPFQINPIKIHPDNSRTANRSRVEVTVIVKNEFEKLISKKLARF